MSDRHKKNNRYNYVFFCQNGLISIKFLFYHLDKVGIMEQRSHDRNGEEIPVWLYKGNNITAIARTRNISKKGLFIVTNVLLFPKGTNFDVVFDSKGSATTVRMPVTVVHRTLEGIGVELREQVASLRWN